MKNNTPCMTCALKVTMRHTDKEAIARINDIRSEINRRNKKSNTVVDLCGIDNKTMFCALDSRHFKNQGRNCRQWIADIGISVSDAIAINLNKKIFWLTVFIVILTILTVIGTFMPLKTPQPVPKPANVTTQNVPPMREDNGQHDMKGKKEGDEAKKDKKIENPILDNNITDKSKEPITKK